MIIKRTLRPNQIVFYQGEAALQTFRVLKGLVRAYTIHDNGEEATVAYFGPDDLFPVASTFDIAPVTLFYYETVTETTVDVMSRQDLDTYLQTYPSEEIHRFAGRYVAALLHVTALTQTTARAKLAHTLRYLALRFGERSLDKTKLRIPIKLTQQDVARLCNASRETMSIELGRLKDEGIISVKEKQYIVHFQKLNDLISDDTAPEIRLG
jgi:CRP/FNR family cyclic AMP-dependent transcriptional regulator